MKTKNLSKSLILGAFSLSLLASPAFAGDSNSSGFGHRLGGFFHHLFAQSPTTEATADATAEPTIAVSTNPIESNPVTAVSVTPVQVAIPGPYVAPVRIAVSSTIHTPTPSPTPAYDSCSEMAPGESRTVDYPTLNQNVFSTGVIPRYLLKRIDDGSSGKSAYEAALNIKFIPHPGETLDTQAMLNYASSCYAALPPIEDANGNSIKIRLATAEESSIAPVRSINLTATHMDREDMTDWSTLSNCRVITHESLHLLGLVDLYQETALKTPSGGQAYDCRKVGPTDSVMRDYTIAHFSNGVYYANTCGCQSNKCAAELAEITETPDACPALADTQSFAISFAPYDIAAEPDTAKAFNDTYGQYLKTGNHYDKYDYLFVSLKPTPAAAFLYPAEFRMITSPGCLAKNSLYLQCAANSYRSTTAGGCAQTELPDACNDPNQWLQ